MLPEIQMFFEANENTDEYYTKQNEIMRDHPVPRWSDNLTAEERAKFYAAEEARDMALLKHKQQMREQRIVTLEALKNHSDPVVRWLVTDRTIQRDYTGYRDAVLKALPMTREEIDAFGDKQGWCGEYNTMLQRAERAGVLPAPVPPLADITPMVDALVRHWGSRRTQFKNILLPHLPAVIESYERMKAEREAAEKEKAEAGQSNTKPAVASRTHVRDANGRFAPATSSAA